MVKFGRKALSATDAVCISPPNNTPSPKEVSSFAASHQEASAEAPDRKISPIVDPEIEDVRDVGST